MLLSGEGAGGKASAAEEEEEVEEEEDRDSLLMGDLRCFPISKTSLKMSCTSTSASLSLLRAFIVRRASCVDVVDHKTATREEEMKHKV